MFDIFCGSGTTVVATKELGRFFVGVGLEEEFCELAAHRGRPAREPLARDLRAALGCDPGRVSTIAADTDGASRARQRVWRYEARVCEDSE